MIAVEEAAVHDAVEDEAQEPPEKMGRAPSTFMPTKRFRSTSSTGLANCCSAKQRWQAGPALFDAGGGKEREHRRRRAQTSIQKGILSYYEVRVKPGSGSFGQWWSGGPENRSAIAQFFHLDAKCRHATHCEETMI